MKKRFCLLIFFVLLFSCGIEDYKYLEPVTDIVSEFTSRATIRPPNSGDTYIIDFPNDAYPKISSTALFQKYTIYYKIYKSDHLSMNVNTEEEYKLVNDTLSTDYKTLLPYTDINNNNTSSIDSLFTNRRFYPIYYDGSGNLLRTNNNGAFKLEPDGYFINTYEIRTTEPSQVVNWDVTENGANAKTYTYAIMYIVAVDFDPQTLTPIYSSPSFINIFMLPDPFVVIPVTGITLTDVPQTTTHAVVQLNANVVPANATNTSIIWTSSNEAMAKVDEYGLVYGIAASGAVTITAKTADGNFEKSCLVNITGHAISSISLSSSTISLAKQATSTLTATYAPIDVAAADADLEWVSSNTAIATVNAGVVIAKNVAGTAVITVRPKYGSKTVSASCTVTVLN
ncbi:MAG: hypothetical protein Ta2B_23140 [Termitinemataceae bacterium]|nr:MAG: hypothetical protein Ta2B_23140 [Termitinemataceae bacterium]